MIDISERLKAIRKDKGYTIQTVADGIGIAVRTYQNYEYGQRGISTETLFKLAAFYGVSTDYLLGRDEEPSPLDELAGQFNMTNLEKKILEGYLALPKDVREHFVDFLKNATLEPENEDNK